MHTKGKWLARENKYGTAVEITGNERAGMCSIAEVEIGFDQPFESEQQANIKLMCAAPALLEALELALLDIERLCERVDSEVGSLRDFDQIVEDGCAPESYSKIIAAIAAAKGE